jgi:PIN domain nuclease of toxin-antitoxin system
MGRRERPLIVIDTHVAIWLFDQETDRFTKYSISVLNESELFISPISKLEMQYLYEIKKIKHEPDVITGNLAFSMGLQELENDFSQIIKITRTLHWTRDPFDRILVAEALLSNCSLLTADKHILKHFPQAFW